VGVLSAALKKGQLSSTGYERLVATTTRLNTPGMSLADLPGVHALTDVTGFGLAGHALEVARGAGLRVVIDWPAVPLLPEVADLALQGFVTGASARNWAAYSGEVTLAANLGQLETDLVTDPQTSGGLLVSCEPAAADAVLSVFRNQGFAEACVIGHIDQGPVGLSLNA
jgi:selenide,water dikinase